MSAFEINYQFNDFAISILGKQSQDLICVRTLRLSLNENRTAKLGYVAPTLR